MPAEDESGESEGLDGGAAMDIPATAGNFTQDDHQRPTAHNTDKERIEATNVKR